MCLFPGQSCGVCPSASLARSSLQLQMFKQNQPGIKESIWYLDRGIIPNKCHPCLEFLATVECSGTNNGCKTFTVIRMSGHSNCQQLWKALATGLMRGFSGRLSAETAHFNTPSPDHTVSCVNMCQHVNSRGHLLDTT